MICNIIKLFYKQPRIFNVLSEIHDDTDDQYITDDTATVSTHKTKSILGQDEYDINPPLCCRLLKRVGVCYMIDRFFKKVLIVQELRINSEMNN